MSDRLFLASGPSKACFRKGWKTENAGWPAGPTAAFYALQGPSGEEEGMWLPQAGKSLTHR